MNQLERKQDTRKKIQLGGLIKKAGLDEELTAVLLGILLEAADTLESDHAHEARKRWQIRGDIELTRC